MRLAPRSNGRTLPLGPSDEASLDLHPLIGQARPEVRAALIAAATQRTVARRGVIVQDGDPCPGLHVVLDGVVQICRVAASGRTFVFRLVRVGDSFGEEVVLAGARAPSFAREEGTNGHAPTPMNASAVTDARLLVFPADAVRSAVVADPGLAEAALGVLARRAFFAFERQQQLALESPAQRLARYLHHHAAEPKRGEGHATVRLDVPKVTVAHYLGTVPEVLARHLRRFERAGVLHRQGRGVLELTDRAALARWAEGID